MMMIGQIDYFLIEVRVLPSLFLQVCVAVVLDVECACICSSFCDWMWSCTIISFGGPSWIKIRASIYQTGNASRATRNHRRFDTARSSPIFISSTSSISSLTPEELIACHCQSLLQQSISEWMFYFLYKSFSDLWISVDAPEQRDIIPVLKRKEW